MQSRILGARPRAFGPSVRVVRPATGVVRSASPTLHAGLIATTAAVASLMLSSSAIAADALQYEGTFQTTCAGCHANGGNIVQPGVTLFPADLKKNGIDSPEALYNIIYGGKNKMPGYGENCAPRGKCTFGRRLTDDEIRGLATYIQAKGETNWQ